MKCIDQEVVKKYSDWKGSLSEYLQIGDLVDDELVEYFINVLPPACMSGEIIQMGEPYSHRNGKATYSTLKMTSRDWSYAGHCYRGQTINMDWVGLWPVIYLKGGRYRSKGWYRMNV